jgi:hypothetical protein
MLIRERLQTEAKADSTPGQFPSNQPSGRRGCSNPSISQMSNGQTGAEIKKRVPSDHVRKQVQASSR